MNRLCTNWRGAALAAFAYHMYFCGGEIHPPPPLPLFEPPPLAAPLPPPLPLTVPPPPAMRFAQATADTLYSPGTYVRAVMSAKPVPSPGNTPALPGAAVPPIGGALP